jgi:general stress protein CsbA
MIEEFKGVLAAGATVLILGVSELFGVFSPSFLIAAGVIGITIGVLGIVLSERARKRKHRT